MWNINVLVFKGAYTNYVDTILLIITTYLPTPLTFVTEFLYFIGAYRWNFKYHLPTSSCQRSLWTLPYLKFLPYEASNSHYFAFSFQISLFCRFSSHHFGPREPIARWKRRHRPTELCCWCQTSCYLCQMGEEWKIHRHTFYSHHSQSQLARRWQIHLLGR